MAYKGFSVLPVVYKGFSLVDIVVKSTDLDPHLADFHLAFERMCRFGLKINRLKVYLA